MFMKRSRLSYARYGKNSEHKVRDLTIEKIFDPFRMVWQVLPALIVLKLCGVVSIRWMMLVMVYAGYWLIDYLSDLFEIWISKIDLKKEEQYYARMAEQEKTKYTTRREKE